MDEQKKQKVLLAVLGVLVLGAGTYFFALRDDGSNRNRAVVNQGSSERRQLKAPESSSRRTRRAPARTTRTAAPAASDRRERLQAERQIESRRRALRGNQERTKKKKITPAA